MKDETFDVVVAGYGFAGGTAALNAAQCGARTLPIEKSCLPGFETVSWAGVLAPAETPRNMLTRQNAEIRKALQSTDVQKRFLELGAETAASTPEEFAHFIKAEIAIWALVWRRRAA